MHTHQVERFESQQLCLDMTNALYEFGTPAQVQPAENHCGSLVSLISTQHNIQCAQRLRNPPIASHQAKSERQTAVIRSGYMERTRDPRRHGQQQVCGKLMNKLSARVMPISFHVSAEPTHSKQLSRKTQPPTTTIESLQNAGHQARTRENQIRNRNFEFQGSI